tara:strand:- start:333 stop:584 length:252 start_codon:yes stop_codon:yes gene_type:complete
MSFSYSGNNYVFTLIGNKCLTEFNDGSRIIVFLNNEGKIIYPSKYIDRNGENVSLYNWEDIFNCYSLPLVGGSEFNDFVPDYF